jgi:hypothetical protein
VSGSAVSRIETDEKKPENIAETGNVPNEESNDVVTKSNKKLVAPEPVLEPKDTIPAQVSPFKEQLETEEKKSVQVDTKVEKPKEIPAIEQQLETGQNSPKLNNNQTQEAILTINGSLSGDNPESPVSDPVDIPAEVKIPPSNEPLEMLDEKVPESLSIMPEPFVDSTGNVTSEDPVLGETQLDEITREMIIPEESERVEEQPAADEAQSKSTADGHQLTDEDSVNRQSPLLTEEEIDDEAPGLSKLMTPDEQMEEEEKEEEKEEEEIEEKENEEKEDEDEEEDEDLLTGNENPIEVVNTPKLIEIKVVGGGNFPEAKDSDKYYVSMRIEERCDEKCDQKKKCKSKTIRASQPEWNQDFSIYTLNPESCEITIKVKKSSIFGLNKSTVGFVKLYVSSLDDGLNELKLTDEFYNPVGEACLKVNTKISDLPKVVASPAEVKRQERKLKTRKIRHGRKPNAAMKSPEIPEKPNKPKPVSRSRKMKEYLVKNKFLIRVDR